jgi:hypothetical protein
MKLQVPFHSQHDEDVPHDCRSTACGIMALKMALDFVLKHQGRTAPSISELVYEGTAIGGKSKDGWIHDKLVLLAHNHGVPAYREEFKSVLVDWDKKSFVESPHAEFLSTQGMDKFTRMFERRTIPLVSVSKLFKERDKFHLVVLTGFGEENGKSGFYYHDPHYKKESVGAHRFVDEDMFRDHWRKLAIFVG